MNMNMQVNGEMEDKLNDISLYGEFVSTFHYWTSSEELHNRGKYLQNLGKRS